MYHYQTQNIFDQEIDFILRFLFEYDSPEQKQQSFAQAQALFSAIRSRITLSSVFFGQRTITTSG